MSKILTWLAGGIRSLGARLARPVLIDAKRWGPRLLDDANVVRTESEWLTTEDAEAMLLFLQGHPLATDRKLQLFASACVRDVGSTRATEVIERFANGEVTVEELTAAGQAAAAIWSVDKISILSAVKILRALRLVSSETAVRRCQAILLRCIFPNPFQPPLAIAPACFRWQGGRVVSLAQAIYDEKAFDRLPILGDALEDAGCADQAILEHCRGPGPHCRGCFVVDLLTGRQ
jgi:hypothetical protein